MELKESQTLTAFDNEAAGGGFRSQQVIESSGAGTSYRSYTKMYGERRLESQEDAKIAQVVSGWAGEDGIAERIEERIGIEVCERIADGVGSI
jgi:hypothetical protein